MLITLIDFKSPVFLEKDQYSEESALKKAGSVTSLCRNQYYYQKCYEKEMSKISKSLGIKSSKEVLAALIQVDQRAKNCHSIAHSIATVEVTKNQNSWESLLDQTNPFECSGGFFHGVLEGKAKFDKGITIDANSINKLCNKQSNSYTKGSCSHVMGHLVVVEDYPNLSKAIQICNDVTDIILKEECLSGIFMENMTKQNLSEHGLENQANWEEKGLQNYEQLCLKYSDIVANACWGEMGFMYSAVYQDNPEIVYRECQKAPKKNFSEKCYLKAVSKISITSQLQEDVNMLCEVYKNEPDLFKNCQSRILSVLISTTIEFSDRAVNFCSSQGDKHRKDCFKSLIGNTLSKISDKEKVRFCLKLPVAYIYECKK